MLLSDVEITFKKGKLLGHKYFAIRVVSVQFPRGEAIINPMEHLDAKLAYYKEAYDQNGKLIASPGIAINKAVTGNDYAAIQTALAAQQAL